MVRIQRNRLTPGGVSSVPSGRGWVVVAVLVITMAALGGPAQAVSEPQTHIDSLYPTANGHWQCVNGVSGNDTPTNLFCLTDNAGTSWYTDSDDSNGTGDIRNPATFELILEGEYEPTALSMSRTFNPKFSGSGETDIVYQQGNLPDNVLGQTWCNDAVEGTDECDQQYVRFAFHFPSAYTICHETGHAVGLTHGAQAFPFQANNNEFFFCMRTPLPPVGDRAPEIGSPLGTIGSQLNAHYEDQ